ncbi:MAG TPA: hypothetical protein VHN12_05430, partial [Geobacteraceae bacterium]|nr:hypothetical protein [Geobacteraceae bacterium]
TVKLSGNTNIVSPAYKLFGLDFSPFEKGQDPNSGAYVPISQIRERMTIIAPYTNAVRSFSSTGGLENTCQVAHEMGLK